MKTKEDIGIFHLVDSISPEAFKAQRQAELKDIAEFRARHIKEVMRWADPKYRAARIKEHEEQSRAAREMVSGQSEVFAEGFRVGDKKPMLVGRTYIKPIKRTWWQRLISMLKMR